MVHFTLKSTGQGGSFMIDCNGSVRGVRYRLPVTSLTTRRSPTRRRMQCVCARARVRVHHYCRMWLLPLPHLWC